LLFSCDVLSFHLTCRLMGPSSNAGFEALADPLVTGPVCRSRWIHFTGSGQAFQERVGSGWEDESTVRTSKGELRLAALKLAKCLAMCSHSSVDFVEDCS
jgi:hypothetical protein